MAEPHTINGAGSPRPYDAAKAARRRRRADWYLERPRVQLEAKCDDAYSCLDNTVELAAALTALWRGVMVMENHKERGAAIAGARRMMDEIKHSIEVVESALKKAQQASSDLERICRPATNGSGY